MATLWQTDQRTCWALNAVSLFRKQRGPAAVGSRHQSLHGRVIRVAKPRRRFGEATHHRTGHVTHLVDRVYIASLDGKEVGRQIRWMCGVHTTGFELTRQALFPLCSLCLARTPEFREKLADARWKATLVHTRAPGS